MTALARVLLLSFFLTTAALFITAAPAAAVITGGCTATGTATSSTADLTSITVWHLKNSDVVNGSGSAPKKQTFIDVGAVVFGVSLPVFSNTGTSQGGKAGPFNVSDYSKYGRVIAVSGSTDSCSGYMTVIVDDENPVANLLGIVSLLLAALGLFGIIAMMYTSGGCAFRILGLILGFLGGFGLGELAVQFGALDPRATYGLAFPIVLAIIGALVPGLLQRRAPAAPPA